MRRLSIRTGGIGLMLLVGVFSPPGNTGSDGFALQSMREHWPSSQREAFKSQTQRFIVQLESPPVAMYLRETGGYGSDNGVPLNLFSPTTRYYRQLLSREADRFEKALLRTGSDLKVKHRFASLFNGVVVDGHRLDSAQLAALPGVKAVFSERQFYTDLDASLEVLGAPDAWRRVGGRDQAGVGVKVAVIDSGIRPEHPMFSALGFTAPEEGLPDDDYCSETDPSFCNSKLIVARWYRPSMSIWPDEHDSPLGFNGHGSHVAGIAVGNRVEVTHQGHRFTLSGVAPGAYLMVYKALFASGYDPTRAVGTNITLLQALEDAVNDGADVINNSWGGAIGVDPAFSPFQQALQAAETAGVVVVSSAGNAGPEPGTIGCPGCVDAGLTVANTTHGRYMGNVLTLGNLPGVYALEGASPIRLADDITATLKAADQIDPTNAKGCRPFADGSFKDSMALVQRGDCPFLDKSEHVARAGAVALVVDNHRSGEPFEMLMDRATIPAVMIDQANGRMLRQVLQQGTTTLATLSAARKPVVSGSLVDMVHLSSSRGPNGDPNILKPDIAAPGALILSAMSPQEPDFAGQSFAMLTGTSMASPHVAGAAAVLKSLHPNWGAKTIKSALTSTARTEGVSLPNAIHTPTPFDVGAGRLDLVAALSASLTFDDTGFADATCILQCQFRTQVTNHAPTKGRWTASATLEGAEVSVEPGLLELASGETVELVVTVNSALAKKGQWLFGRVAFSGDSEAHLPMAIFPDISDDTNLATVYSDEPNHQYGERAQYHAVLFNREFSGPVTVVLQSDDGLLIDPDSVQTRLMGGQEQSLIVDEPRQRLTWQGQLDQSMAAVTEVPPPAFPSQASDANRIPCFGSCDEVSLVYATPLPFEFQGKRYSQLTLSSNGYLSPGETKANSSWINHSLPELLAPNKVIAPFWTDLDLQDEDFARGQGDGGGTLHLYQVKDEQGEPHFLVVDWIDAQLAGYGDGQRYSFGVWLGVGPEQGNNLLRYYKLGPLPTNLTVGVEDELGLSGAMRYHNGEGVGPMEGETLKVTMRPAGQLAIDFVLNSVLAPELKVTTQEESPITVNVVPPDTHPLTMTARNETSVVEAVRLVDFGVSEEVTITILEPPSAGTVELQGDNLIYQPEIDFFGRDSVRFELRDGGGNLILQQQMVIDVTGVNDAPKIRMPPSYQIGSGERLAVNLVASDIEKDPIQWQVSQRQGPPLTATIEGSTLNVTAPRVSQGETAVLAVVASDPLASSEPTLLQFSVSPTGGKEETDGGGGTFRGLDLVILLWLLAHRRRRQD
ncbi:S8 family serine peptidase [Halomonas denitrificans]|nr:S8 family serine peptidase [Halomonas denitrificans]